MHSSTSNSKRYGQIVLGVGAALTFGFFAVTEWLIRTRVSPAHPFPRYMTLFRSAPNADAAFGDSLVEAAFTGQAGFVNLARAGDNFAGMEKKVRLYYRDRPVGRVVLQAGLHHLSRHYMKYRDDGSDFADLYLTQGMGGLRILDPIYRYEIATYWKMWLLQGQFVPRNRFVEDGARLSSDNYASYPTELRAGAARQVAQLTLPAPPPEQTPVLVNLRALIRDLQARGAQPCLVTYPASGDVLRATVPLPEFQAARAVFAAVAAETGIRYVDLYELALPDSLFSDFTHLNETGARQVSPLVTKGCFG